MLYDGDTFERGGLRFRVTFPHDADHSAPWEQEDGHGPVSDWTRRDKAPGELVLCDDDRTGLRGNASHRFYDFAEACKIARRDGWGFLPGELVTKQEGGEWIAYVVGSRRGPNRGERLFEARAEDVNTAIGAVYAAHKATMSPRAYAAGAARKDFERLRDWCNDEWHYVGVVVELLDEDGDATDDESVWGIESDSGAYLEETAHELADEILARVAAEERRRAVLAASLASQLADDEDLRVAVADLYTRRLTAAELATEWKRHLEDDAQ